jgi:hypothetical protein
LAIAFSTDNWQTISVNQEYNAANADQIATIANKLVSKNRMCSLKHVSEMQRNFFLGCL